MTPIPANAVEPLIEKLTKLYQTHSSYISPADPDFLDIADDAEKLGKVDGGARSVILAELYGLAGDRKQADYYLDNARRLNVAKNRHDLAQINMLQALGYFSEAAKVIEACGEPERNLLNLFLAILPDSGLIRLMADFHRKASEMNLTNLPDFPESYKDAICIMDSWGDTDADYAAVLDIAGMVMRERRLLTDGQGLVVKSISAPLDGGTPYVKLGLEVNVDVDTAIDMTCDFSELLAKSGIKIPQSMLFEFFSVAE